MIFQFLVAHYLVDFMKQVKFDMKVHFSKRTFNLNFSTTSVLLDTFQWDAVMIARRFETALLVLWIDSWHCKRLFELVMCR